MDWYYSLLLIVGPFVVLLALGLPVAFTFIFIMLFASVVLMGSPTGPYMTVMSLFNSIALFSLAPVPLFVLMGEVLLHSGLAKRSMDALSKILPAKIPARLSILSNLGGALFGMLSGSTMASTAVLGSVLVPEMRKMGYSKKMTFGPILASGGLAMIIPPSSLAIIYGTIAKIPIGKLLIAGLIPGLIMTFNYMANIIIRTLKNPSLAPPYETVTVKTSEKIRIVLTDLLPLSIIVFLVTGIFILGIATPTEAAALGAMGTIITAAVYRHLTVENFIKAVKGTATITTMTLLIIGGSQIFSQLLGYSGITRSVVNYIIGLELPPMGILLLMIGIILVLGCFMESVPIMMITTPLFVPVASHMGFDPIWFGIVILISLEIGMTTPPFGLLLFVMKGVAPKDTTMPDLYRSALPFIAMDVIAVTLVILFPALALWLPSILMGR